MPAVPAGTPGRAIASLSYVRAKRTVSTASGVRPKRSIRSLTVGSIRRRYRYGRRPLQAQAAEQPRIPMLPAAVALTTRVEVDEREPADGIEALVEMCGRFDQHHLERRPDVTLEQVPTPSGAVPISDDDVRVDGRLAVVEGNVSDERDHFDLFVDRNRLVVLLLPVEVAEHEIAERADARELRGAEVVSSRKAAQPVHCLVAEVEDEHEGAAAVGFGDDFRLHVSRLAALANE